jgi:hypothetical protein
LRQFESNRQLSHTLHLEDSAKIMMKDAELDGEAELIEINPDSTIASDLMVIWHNKHQAEICICLNEGSRHPNLSLVGLVSGKSIAMLEWSLVVSTTPYTEYCGSYLKSWMDPGSYFLEVLIIHCKRFGTTALEKLETNYNDDVEKIGIEERLALTTFMSV